MFGYVWELEQKSQQQQHHQVSFLPPALKYSSAAAQKWWDEIYPYKSFVRRNRFDYRVPRTK